MPNWKHFFGKGYFPFFIGLGCVLQFQRYYYIPKPKMYQEILKKAKQELDFTEPQVDHSAIKLQTLSVEDLNKLKKITKRQITQIQSLHQQKGSTTLYTFGVLSLGTLNYFFHPTLGALFVSIYLALLQIDYMKSLTAINTQTEQLWQWKMKDVGFVLTSTLGFITLALFTKRGLAKMQERVVSKALVAKEPANPEKNKDE